MLWVHVLGLFGNSHWSANDNNSKECLRLTYLSEEAMTELASISFEQRTWQWIHRIAVLSGCEELIVESSGCPWWPPPKNDYLNTYVSELIFACL